jgi:hypothetical protein
MQRRAFDPTYHCGARRQSDDIKGPGRRGDPCQQRKGAGTDHVGIGPCKWHTGNSPNARRHAERVRAEQALASLGVPIQTDPQQALLEQVWEAYGNVAFLREAVRQLQLPGAIAQAAADAAASGEPATTAPGDAEAVRVYGPDHLGDARPHVLVEMYGEERDRLAKVCKLAIDAGIAQRHLDLVERMADPIVAVVMAALEGLPPEERDRRQRLATAKLAEFADWDILAVGAGARTGSAR